MKYLITNGWLRIQIEKQSQYFVFKQMPPNIYFQNILVCIVMHAIDYEFDSHKVYLQCDKANKAPFWHTWIFQNRQSSEYPFKWHNCFPWLFRYKLKKFLRLNVICWIQKQYWENRYNSIPLVNNTIKSMTEDFMFQRELNGHKKKSANYFSFPDFIANFRWKRILKFNLVCLYF